MLFCGCCLLSVCSVVVFRCVLLFVVCRLMLLVVRFGRVLLFLFAFVVDWCC